MGNGILPWTCGISQLWGLVATLHLPVLTYLQEFLL